MKMLWLLFAVLFALPAFGQSYQPFTGEKSSWHGFDRYDFLMDEGTGTIRPVQATTGIGDGLGAHIAGQRRCVVVVPREPAAGHPWSWRGCYWNHQPQAEVELLRRGFCIAYIEPEPGPLWDKWYDFLTRDHGLSVKPAFIGMSKGGFNEFEWATAHPDEVSCIYADNPAISRESLMNLWRLAAADVPLLHICGSMDPILGNPSWVLNNTYQILYGTRTIEALYRQLGGRISVMVKEGMGHHPHSLVDPKPIADFIQQSCADPGPPPAPDFVPARFARTAYYSAATDSSYYPSEKAYVDVRGPWFSGAYYRYGFVLDSPKITLTVIAPRVAAPGKPWALRADFVGRRDAARDLVLLSKGYYVVIGPVGTNADGPVSPEWNAMYNYLVSKGFSKKPLLEADRGSEAWMHTWAPPRDYHFDGTISRPVLDNYLSRAITMEGLLNGRGNFEDNLRMIRNIGAKFIGRSICLWGGESRLLANFERAREEMPQVRAIDPDLILEACIFEIVTTQVDQVPVPDWAFTALGMPVEHRNFRYDDMLYPDGRRKDQWGPGASVPDVSRPETKLWFYFLAKSYIDLGFEAIHFGQVEIMDGNDPDLSNWDQVFGLVRAYAAEHARRHMVLLDAHVPSGGLVRNGRLLLDFHAFPLRIEEVSDTPQHAILQLGFSDGIYRRSKGGITPSGWACDHLPYLVEFDNYGVSKAPGQPGQGHGGFDWIWGYDEITWFAHQSPEYRNAWLHYAWNWVQETDSNGHLEMPGARTEASPLDHRRWYSANRPSAAVPDGLDDESTIKEIWAADSGDSVPSRQPEGFLEGRGQLYAGTAKVNLTPSNDEPLHDSIYARALVLDAGGLKIGFVSVDLAVFTSPRVVEICEQKYGLAQLLICSSHNHSEPQKYGGRSFEPGNPYARFYEDQIIRAVGMAVANEFPARISAGHRVFPQLGFNRLIVRDDGHARESWFGDSHYSSENPERIPFGPVDPEVGVLRIDDLSGHPRAIVMNYACHADVVCFNYAISADYPGVACSQVEKAFGDSLTCLFVQGAAGNVEPLMISSRRTGPNDPFQTDYRPMERTGELLADQVIPLARSLRPSTEAPTDLRFTEDSLTFTGRFNKNLLFDVHESTILIDSTILIGACPGELFSTLALDWKAKVREGGGDPFYFGYSWSGGKWPGYVADIRSAALGGFGADQDPGIIQVGAGENMMLLQLEDFYRLNGLMRPRPGPVGFTPGNRWVITPVPPGKP